MLSLTCKTAIKAVIYLSCKREENKKISAKEIAEQINASEHTVSKALQLLVRQGVINSLKGPSGGFFLTEKQQNQPIYTIVETVEGKGIFTDCGLGLSKCSETHPCPIHNEYKVARELVEKIFREKRVIDLHSSVSNGLAYLIG
ncbi:MAG: Rrf2 family transcriptional regulator [Weeksellaceae bacterium]|jgi:Rrf2 family protein|nr:Rrf2 family transcriptional regulator [Weeksellaceae bacterium]